MPKLLLPDKHAPAPSWDDAVEVSGWYDVRKALAERRPRYKDLPLYLASYGEFRGRPGCYLLIGEMSPAHVVTLGAVDGAVEGVPVRTSCAAANAQSIPREQVAELAAAELGRRLDDRTRELNEAAKDLTEARESNRAIMQAIIKALDDAGAPNLPITSEQLAQGHVPTSLRVRWLDNRIGELARDVERLEKSDKLLAYVRRLIDAERWLEGYRGLGRQHLAHELKRVLGLLSPQAEQQLFPNGRYFITGAVEAALELADNRARAAQVPDKLPATMSLPEGTYECRCSSCRATFYSPNKRSFWCGSCPHPSMQPHITHDGAHQRWEG